MATLIISNLMCGINVIIDKSRLIGKEAIQQMLSATAHRGPDYTGRKFFSTGDVNLHVGANRLRIHDITERSDQPLHDVSGRYALVFNGEIYNYEELKNKLLETGCIFRTSSDTEVLLHWLIQRGEKGISELNGMFAFVFFDLESGGIIAARDSWGIKPLYYVNTGGQIIVSSELQGILASGLVKRSLNRNQVAHYLQYKYARRPETFYEGILELEPGCFLKYEKGEYNINSYKEVSKFLNDTTYGEKTGPLTKEVEKLLRDSLLTHLQSEAPLGLLLSGGVDSTLLLALAKEEGYSVPTFSIVNRRSDISFGTEDYKYARKAAMQYRSDHTVLEVDDTILEGFNEFIGQMDQPVADSGAWMTWLICRKAAETVKVVLSGAGADELFAGYNRHHAYYWYLKHDKIVKALTPAIRTAGSVLPDGGSFPLRKQLRLFKKWAESIDINPEITWNRMISTREFMDVNKTMSWPDISKMNAYMNYALENDRLQYLVSDVLTISDRMSMQSSLEMRLPYLDRALSDFVRSISPEKLLMHGGKGILKGILESYGGKKYARRKKEGFGLPAGNWFRNKKHDYLWELFSGNDHLIFDFVKREEILSLINRHRKGSIDFSQELWSVLILGHWLAKEFE